MFAMMIALAKFTHHFTHHFSLAFSVSHWIRLDNQLRLLHFNSLFLLLFLVFMENVESCWKLNIFVRDEGVGGSNPLIPTNKINGLAVFDC
jgi:hypothetical protein